MDLDLVAQSSDSDHRWRRSLRELCSPTDQIMIGRIAGSWSVPWDDRISKQHACLSADGNVLKVLRVESARNPIFFKGQRADQFALAAGDHFVIGSTTFTVAKRPQTATPRDPQEPTQQAFDLQQLRKKPFRDAGKRIDVLGRLPDLIMSSTSDDELWVRVGSVLLQGIPSSTVIAVVALQQGDEIAVRHFDSRLLTTDQEHQAPSASLIREAMSSGESVLHLWSDRHAPRYTENAGVDWAFCVPIAGEQQHNLGLYVAGTMEGLASAAWSEQTAHAADGLQDDLKFAELVATTIANIRNMRSLQQRHAGLQQFFAPVVMNALVSRETEDTLAPREADISVLFCDLRGFSRQSEKLQDRLLQLLERVSEALGLMTRQILATGGVIGDFHGDAAMGFWGWPLQQFDAPARACNAALAILEEFLVAGSDENRHLADFHCGIGVASGRAVAGRIGTVDQVKVTAFGPVVNLASRLEGMTKQLAAEILVDEMTADYMRTHIPRATCRIRRLAKVRPAGVETPLVVSQVLPPYGPLCSLSDEHLMAYEDALDALIDRRWEYAFERLHDVPASDRAKDFLTVFIAQHGRMAPPDWNGTIDLPKY